MILNYFIGFYLLTRLLLSMGRRPIGEGILVRVRPEDYETLNQMREELSLRTFGDVVAYLLDDGDEEDSFQEDEA